MTRTDNRRADDLALLRVPRWTSAVRTPRSSDRARILPTSFLAIAAILALILGAFLSQGVALGAEAAPRTIAGTETVLDVACSTATSCLAVGDDFSTSPAQAVVAPLTIQEGDLSVGTLRISAAPDGFALRGVACPTSASCVAVGTGRATPQGIVVALASDGSGFGNAPPETISTPGAESDLSSVACPTPTTCVAVGSSSALPGSESGSGEVALIGLNRGRVTIRTAEAIPGLEGLWDVACPTSATCLAVGTASPSGIGSGTAGIAVRLTLDGERLDVGPVESVASVDNLYGIACPTSAVCLSVADGDTRGEVVPLIVRSDALSIGPARAIGTASGAQGAPRGIACPTSTTCVATGGNSTQGLAVPISIGANGLALGPIQKVAGTSNLVRVACPTSLDCVAVGTNLPSGLLQGQGIATFLEVKGG